MGDMSDLLDYWEDDYTYEEEELLDKLAQGVWVTGDGVDIKISNMETSHIYNCINWIKRTFYEASFMYEYLPLFEKELQRRP